MTKRTEKFEQSIIDLKNNFNADTCLNFLIAGSYITRQGSGLMWDDVKKIIESKI